MDLTPAVKPEYGPTLPELLRARLPRRARVALGVVVVLIVVAIVVALAAPRGSNDIRYIHRSAPQFNLKWSKGARLQRVKPDPGAFLKLEARRGGQFLQSLEIRPLHLPAYRGAATGFLPVFAADRAAQLAKGSAGFAQLGEGKARVNDVSGYQLSFKTKLGARTVWGREVYLLPDDPGARDGVTITLLQTPAAGAKTADDVGNVGALRRAYRSFRYGTTWP